MHSVYFAYSAGHTLLYVGVTDNVNRRLNNHKSLAVWYEHMAYRRTRQFEDRARAEAFEARSISLLKPLFNHRGLPEGFNTGPVIVMEEMSC